MSQGGIFGRNVERKGGYLTRTGLDKVFVVME